MSSQNRRAALKAAAVTAVFALSGIMPQVAAAQEAASFPSGPVTMVVPFPPGGATDNLARVVANRLSEKWGKPVLVDNRSGGSGMIGAELVARAKPDGHTIMHTLSTLIQAPHLYPSLKLEPLKAFETISMSATNGLLLVVHDQVPAHSLEDLVKLARAEPEKYSYGSYGVGTTGHLYGYMFNSQSNLNMVHVGYRGEAPSVVDLLGHQIPMVIMSGNGAKAHLQTGKMRAIAATGSERSLVAPDTPTFTELGYKNMDLNGWYGFFAPAGTPKAIVDKISMDINEVLADPEVKASFRAIDIKLLGTTPEVFAEQMNSDYEKWGKIIREAGVTAE